MEASKQIEDSYPELFPRDFGERLERLRDLAGLSWEEFAERLSVVSCDLAPLMDERESRSFFASGSGLSGWGEIGSRGFIRSCLGDCESVYGSGWEDVQVGRFSYSADSGGDRVRMIFSNYLYVTVHLEPV